MSWEELPSRTRSSRKDWSIAIKKTGIYIYIPKNHVLSKEKGLKVKSFIGKKDHEGSLRLELSTEGRAIYYGKSGSSIKFSTLPGAPKELSNTILDVKEDLKSFTFKLPWRTPNQGYSMLR